MRPIDADALTQELGITDMDCCKCAWYSKAYRRCKRGGDFEDVCTAIDDAPTIEPDVKWIPTSIRKPTKAGQYLVTKQQKTKGVRQLATAHYNPALDDWSGNGNFTNVLAWMPLPTIYGGD